MLSVQIVHLHAAQDNQELQNLLNQNRNLYIDAGRYQTLKKGWELCGSHDLPNFINELCQSDQAKKSNIDTIDIEQGNNCSNVIIKAIEKTIIYKFTENIEFRSQFCTTFVNVIDNKIDLIQTPNPELTYGTNFPILSWLYNHKHDPIFEYCTQTTCMKPVIQHYIKHGFVGGVYSIINSVLEENSACGMQFIIDHYNFNQNGLDNLLRKAIRKDADNAIPLLVSKGANIKIRGHNRITLLHAAAIHKAINSIPILAAHIDINIQDTDGQTPLHYAAAAELGDIDPMNVIITLLLENGADVHKKDRAGKTPLHIAAYSMSCSVIPALLQAGARINDRDNTGQTPLHSACSSDDNYFGNMRNVISQLIDAGADLDAADHTNKKPEDYSSLLTAVLLFKNRS